MAFVAAFAMRVPILPALVGALCLLQAAAAQGQNCKADKNSRICGEGKDALRIFEDTASPSGS
jgi:hypothetical protein